MKFHSQTIDIFIPDNCDALTAIQRTTHLAIGAHQDDLEIFAYHGIAECFRKQDKWFTGVVVTNGAGSPRSGIYSDCLDSEMQKIRILEQKKAAYVGEYGALIQLNYPSSQVKDATIENVVEDLHTILENARAQTVYLHNPADKHDTHIAVFLRSLAALHKLPKNQRPQQAYGCEVWRNLDWLLDQDKQILPVNDYNNIAAALVAVFDSQISGGKRYDLATAGRRLANATYYDSHSVDVGDALSWAMDLTPLVQDETKSVLEYTNAFIQRFQNDVAQRLEKFS